MITVITAPVDVDAAAISAGELGQREAGWVGWRGGQEIKTLRLFALSH